MWECRYRIESLRELTSGKTHCSYLQTTIESEALQLRKLLELIAFATLVSYQDAYRSVRKDIAKDWHAERILRKIEDINPKFYPVPIDGINESGWNRLRGGYLTRKQFERLYDKCGAILHANNPFSKETSLLAFHRKVPEYLVRIENLLSEHLMELANSQELIHVIAPMEGNAPIQVRHIVRNNNFV